MESILLHEVGLRDGLQMESRTVPLEKKVKWTEKLIEANIDVIQLGSFVHPYRVPQMADTDDLFKVMRKIFPHKEMFSGLVLNEKGLERALDCGVDIISMGVSASDTHSLKNTRMKTEEALERITKMAVNAMDEGKTVQVSVQSAFGCGFEGKISESRVFNIIDKYLESGIKNISIADTAGHAYPEQVSGMIEEILGMDKDINLNCHFHNTYGLGLANCIEALKHDIYSLETAIAGLGGCPFTKLPAGNVCTEDLVNYLHRNKIRNDIDLPLLIDIAEEAANFFERQLPGLVYKAGFVSY